MAVSDAPELCFNLWYHIDADQAIRAIYARAYMLSGSDADKERMLVALSVHDWRTVSPSPPGADIQAQYGGSVPYSALRQLGVEVLFADQFRCLVSCLPPGVEAPDEKLFFATPLFDFGAGLVATEIGDGYIRERS